MLLSEWACMSWIKWSIHLKPSSMMSFKLEGFLWYNCNNLWIPMFILRHNCHLAWGIIVKLKLARSLEEEACSVISFHHKQIAPLNFAFPKCSFFSPAGKEFFYLDNSSRDMTCPFWSTPSFSSEICILPWCLLKHIKDLNI